MSYSPPSHPSNNSSPSQPNNSNHNGSTTSEQKPLHSRLRYVDIDDENRVPSNNNIGKSASSTKQHYAPFSVASPPPVFETVDFDAPMNLSSSKNTEAKKTASSPQPLGKPSFFVQRAVLGDETSKLFEKNHPAAKERLINDSDSDSAGDDDDENVPPPPKEPYPFSSSNKNAAAHDDDKSPSGPQHESSSPQSREASVNRRVPPPPPPPEESDAEKETKVPRFTQFDSSSPPQKSTTTTANANTQNQNLAHKMTTEEMLKKDKTDSSIHHDGTDDDDDDDEEEQDYGEEDYSILLQQGVKKNKSYAQDDTGHSSPSGDAETQPDFRDVECMFHQLRLEQRVAGELAGVLREQPYASQSVSVRAAIEKQKELKRLRDALFQREHLQIAREQETSYQQEEVSGQSVKRLDGVTDVLQRSLEAETEHFSGMRALEDRIINKQRAAQIKKLELQRLQEIAEDCISQLTTFELRNTSRDRMIQNLEKENEVRRKEWTAVQETLDKRVDSVMAREKKIAEWVEALETKEKHLTNQDEELKAFAEEFLRREEAVRLAKTSPSTSIHNNNVNNMHHPNVAGTSPLPSRTNVTTGISAHDNSNSIRPPQFSSTSNRFAVPNQNSHNNINNNNNQQPQKSSNDNGKTAQHQDHTPEQLDRDDDYDNHYGGHSTTPNHKKVY